ncbi:MAG: DinB family protein [Acidimicrobiales bacterium]
MSEEATALLGTLDKQRRHVLGMVEGLTEEELRRPVLPSGWACLDLVQHLALDVERFWFRRVVAGEPEPDDWAVEDGWQIAPEVSSQAVLDLYRSETALAKVITASTPLDAAPKWWPEELFGSWRLDDLREILLHVIAETACHAGHVDAARELIDGRLWLVLNK